MKFENLSRHEAQLYIEGYAAGIEGFRDSIGFMESALEGPISYPVLKDLASQLADATRTNTMARVMALYDEMEKE